VTDAVLVRAPLDVVYRTLTDLDAWPRWLDGCTSRRPGAAATLVDGLPADRHLLVLPGVRGFLRLDLVVYGWQHQSGSRWDVTIRRPGRRAVAVSTEWWLESCREGVIVHHVIHGSPASRQEARATLLLRRSVVLALQAMKDRLELAVAHAAGRIP
jgi:uncharacterized protein YndB with AHSA1/START domain